MRRFDAAIAALEAETGWKATGFQAGGSDASFELGDFGFACHSPDDRRFFFLFRLYATSPGETPEEKARGYARMAAASALARRTVLSFDEGAFNLHLEADLAETPPKDIPGLCREFLNDCDWWRQNEPPPS
jgi:hypothetical protein